MSLDPMLPAYLVRDSLMRWRGRLSSPFARLAVAGCLSTAALLVLASFALAAATLKDRIAEFGLDSLVIRTPVSRVSDPVPGFPVLAAHGRVLTLKIPYVTTELDVGGHTTLAMADERTLQELAEMGVQAAAFPVLLTASLPAGIPVRAGLGPWWIETQTFSPPASLRPLGLPSLLIARPGDFPMQAMTPGLAVTVFARSATAAPMAEIVAALETVIAANPAGRETSPSVQSALPLLHKMAALQASWQRYAALLAVVLVATITAVFGSTALLEYEATAYTAALLRSFGVSRLTLWFQRYAEAALLANLGGLLALLAAAAIARLTLPQFAPFAAAMPVFAPVFLALNAGALLAAIPVALALRKPVGAILQ